MKISELQERLDLIPSDAELVGMTCKPHSMGACPQTDRKRFEFCFYFTIMGVDSKIEGEYMSNYKVKYKTDEPQLTQRPFASLSEHVPGHL